MEKEEAQALVAALEQSNLQQGHLPYVPGLSKEKDDETLTIHIQDEVRILICLTSLTRAKCGTRSTLCWKLGNISGSTELFAL